jgi:hypothetical protein
MPPPIVKVSPSTLLSLRRDLNGETDVRHALLEGHPEMASQTGGGLRICKLQNDECLSYANEAFGA